MFPLLSVATALSARAPGIFPLAAAPSVPYTPTPPVDLLPPIQAHWDVDGLNIQRSFKRPTIPSASGALPPNIQKLPLLSARPTASSLPPGMFPAAATPSTPYTPVTPQYSEAAQLAGTAAEPLTRLHVPLDGLNSQRSFMKLVVEPTLCPGSAPPNNQKFPYLSVQLDANCRPAGAVELGGFAVSEPLIQAHSSVCACATLEVAATARSANTTALKQKAHRLCATGLSDAFGEFGDKSGGANNLYMYPPRGRSKPQHKPGVPFLVSWRPQVYTVSKSVLGGSGDSTPPRWAWTRPRLPACCPPRPRPAPAPGDGW